MTPTGGLPARPLTGRCPACHSDQLEPVLEQRQVPIHTSTLLPSRDDAMSYPRGDLELVVCRACGLLTNTAFDAPTHDYSASYEEVQSFSPRFREYQRSLAQSLVQRHQLSGRDVFEIGCGRGDFLLELCEATGGRGYGVDPSFSEERLEGEVADRVLVQRDFFAPEHVPEGVGAIVCRHTLEHVHDVQGFLRAVRLGLERAPDAVVVFEVPDTWRVLEETAFWDLFYEHCSYFTAGSFARAFRAAGLAPERLERTFDDQYLLLTAHTGFASEEDALPLEEPAADVVALSARFAEGIRRAREQWGGLLGDAHGRGERAVIWGAGSKGVGFLSTLGVADEVTNAVDVNPAKHGMHMPGTGHEIVSPDRLREIRPRVVIVMNPAYEDEIAHELSERGIEARVVSL